MSPAEPQEKKSPNLWLAVLPGVLVFLGAIGMFFFSSFNFAKVGAIITAPDPKNELAVNKPAPGELLACIETHSVTMHTSESYVAERGGFAQQRRKNAPTELATVLRGMVRNNCGRPIRRVELFFEVRDAEGRRGAGWVFAGPLDQGQGATFEKAWMGRVTEYKVTKAR